MKIENWDWKKFLPAREYHKLYSSHYPGWETINNGDLLSVEIYIIKGKDRDSRDVAVEFDDIAQGDCYYRDFTQSSLPFVRDGEAYCSLFTFQLFSDYLKFKEIYNIV